MNFSYKKALKMSVRNLKFLALSSMLLYAGEGFAQTQQIQLPKNQITIKEVFRQIEKQTKLSIGYNYNKLSKVIDKKVSISSGQVQYVLTNALKGTGLVYSFDGNHIIITPQNQENTVKKTIRGKVYDNNGEPVIGATIKVVGTSVGTITDFDGLFSLETYEGSPLEISYVGFKTQKVTAKAGKPLDITLREDSKVLNEVVVTALGIKREKKMLGYAVQDLKGDEVNPTGDPSITSALEGKVAGMQLNTSATGLGGSTKITIRGNSSLTDNNQPLWIVDGVPFSDQGNSSAGFYGGLDRGGSAVDINPNDIESISVLKGPNAAALYGSRAGNGVILITTKKGSKSKGFGVKYNGSFTWSKVAETIDMQDRYGQGHIDVTGGAIYHSADDSSWGPVLDGDMKQAWNGETYAFSKYGNKLKDFFETGFSHNHNVSISNGSEKSHFRTSFGHSSNESVFPTEKLTRTNLDLNAGSEINKYFSMDGKISLSRTKAKNRPYFGTYGHINQLMNVPHNVRLEDLEQYSDEDHVHLNWTGPTSNIRNPYYILHSRKNSDERWRAFGHYSLNLNFTDWLHLTAKYAFDYYRTRIQETTTGNGILGESNSSMIKDDSMKRAEQNFFESNAEVILRGEHKIFDHLNLGFNVGANFMYQKSENLSSTVGDMLTKDSWIFNAANRILGTSETGSERAMNSVFGAAQFTWKDYLSLDLTARNDWSSTLPIENNSFFYPSANLSFVVSDFFKSINKELPSWITFAKVRASAAQVGKDTTPYQLYNTYSYSWDYGVLKPNKSSVKKNDQLKPEIATSYEAGLDMKFFNNRFGFDFTYYYSKTKNQIMKVPAAAPWSGGKMINAGLITNQGVELMLYSKLVQTKDFNFDLDVNLAHNVSKVKELSSADNVNYMFFSGDSKFPIKVGARTGHKLGEIYATRLYKRNENGDIIVGKNGLPTVINKEKEYVEKPIGNIQPKLTMSVTPTFEYKGVTLSALFDMRFGGNILSYSEMATTKNGLAARTMERGEANNYMMVFPGVTVDNQPNTSEILASKYYGALLAEDFLYDASFIKLKELSVGYTFPHKLLKKTPLTSLNVSFVARNLCYLLKHTPGTSPEGGYNTSMFSQAIDFTSVPFTRTFGLSINVGF